jgi:2-oxoglutarate ferredoxin oxidoreductase subunit gamma
LVREDGELDTHQDFIIAGFGGQGILLAGQLLAAAGMLEDRKVVFYPAYGPEMRGGTANCTVVISDEEVGSPIVTYPSASLVMNAPSMTKYEPMVKPGGVLVVNRSLINQRSTRTDITVVEVPANDIAFQLGNDRVATMVALAVLRAFARPVSFESLVAGLDEVLPERRKHLKGANVKALEAGEKFAAQLVESGGLTMDLKTPAT